MLSLTARIEQYRAIVPDFENEIRNQKRGRPLPGTKRLVSTLAERTQQNEDTVRQHISRYLRQADRFALRIEQIEGLIHQQIRSIERLLQMSELTHPNSGLRTSVGALLLETGRALQQEAYTK